MEKHVPRYVVVDSVNFYDGMVGTLVYETPMSVILEFQLSEQLGGIQRVQFFKKQVKPHDYSIKVDRTAPTATYLVHSHVPSCTHDYREITSRRLGVIEVCTCCNAIK